MFNDALKEVTGLLDRRFLLNIFFPCLVFCGLLMAVGLIGTGEDLIKIAKAWSKQDVGVQILQIVGFLSLITVFAGIVDSQLPTIIRFFEGYPPMSRRLTSIGKTFHQIQLEELGKHLRIMNKINTKLEQCKQKKKELAQKWEKFSEYSELEQKELEKLKRTLSRKTQNIEARREKLTRSLGNPYGFIYSYYPLPTQNEEVMPTRFGNILKNSERYPSDRYGVDAVVIWSRLYHLFPDRFIQIIAEAKSSVDFMLVISTLSGIFALISGVYLLIVKASYLLFLLCFWGGLAVAWLAYRGALASAVIYAQQIKTGFDLYRQELFKQMHLKLPHNLKSEKEQWKEVDRFLYQNFPLSSEYTEINTEESPETKKKESSP